MSGAQLWKVGGEQYLPTLADAETEWQIPTDLLARIAYQESSWRQEVVSCSRHSRAGCLGLMQLNPTYFPDAGSDWQKDVQDAAELLASHYRRFADWQLAVAAYNDGAGNIDMWVKGQRALPIETVNYVGHVIADVPVPGDICPT